MCVSVSFSSMSLCPSHISSKKPERSATEIIKTYRSRNDWADAKDAVRSLTLSGIARQVSGGGMGWGKQDGS